MPKPRKQRRQASSDEEMEGVEDTQQAPATQQQAGPTQPVATQEGQDELPPFDPDSYERVVISAANHSKMKVITDSWDFNKVPLELLGGILKESAVMLTEAGEAADPILLRNMDHNMREVVDLQNGVSVRKDASMTIRQTLTQGAKIVNPDEVWQEKVDAATKEYEKKTSRQKYANNAAYSGYKEEIWQVKHEGPMPPLKSVMPREEGDDSDDDDDLDVGGMTVSMKDPLTRLWLDNPVTSKLCGHSYSLATISEFLGAGRGTSKKCPEAGCNKQITKADLEANETLARQVRNAQRREEERKRDGNRNENKTQIEVDDDEVVD